MSESEPYATVRHAEGVPPGRRPKHLVRTRSFAPMARIKGAQDDASALMVSFFVASTVVTLLQYLRIREARLLPLLALFAMLALAHSRDDWRASRAFHLGAGAAGLALLVMLSPRHSAPH